jgi:hypothetical protein
MNDLNPTTRMYPRTLRDAFKQDAENTQWWYPPEKHVSFWDIVVGGAGVLLWLCLAYYFAT